MKIKNLFAVAALLMASASAFAAGHVISPVTLVDNQGINYNVVQVIRTRTLMQMRSTP
jgi:hypothetical protein